MIVDPTIMSISLDLILYEYNSTVQWQHWLGETEMKLHDLHAVQDCLTVL